MILVTETTFSVSKSNMKCGSQLLTCYQSLVYPMVELDDVWPINNMTIGECLTNALSTLN